MKRRSFPPTAKRNRTADERILLNGNLYRFGKGFHLTDRERCTCSCRYSRHYFGWNHAAVMPSFEHQKKSMKFISRFMMS